MLSKLYMEQKFTLCYGYLFQIEREIPKTFENQSLHTFNSMADLSTSSDPDNMKYEDRRPDDCKEALALMAINRKYNLILVVVINLIKEYEEELTEDGKAQYFSDFRYLLESLEIVEDKFRIDKVGTIELDKERIDLIGQKITDILVKYNKQFAEKK